MEKKKYIPVKKITDEYNVSSTFIYTRVRQDSSFPTVKGCGSNNAFLFDGDEIDAWFKQFYANKGGRKNKDLSIASSIFLSSSNKFLASVKDLASCLGVPEHVIEILIQQKDFPKTHAVWVEDEVKEWYGTDLKTFEKEKDLTQSVSNKTSNIQKKPSLSIACKDHLGNLFSSKKARADYWHRNVTSIESWLKKGFTLEEALTGKLLYQKEDAGSKDINTRYKDHEGRYFNSLEDMCKFWDISPELYQKRLRSHWTQEEALALSEDGTQHKFTVDGELFKTLEDCAKAYGITNFSKFCKDIKINKMSVKEAIEAQD